LVQKELKINTNLIAKQNELRMDQLSHLVEASQDFVTFDNLERKIDECIKFPRDKHEHKLERNLILKKIVMKQ
jgi:hypothetical protein